jgi:hypothetical protein
MKVILTLFATAFAIVQISCTSLSKHPKKDADKESKKVEIEAPRLIGRIASIPQDKRFVLIQSYAKWTIEAGTILTTQGPENRSANLLVTGEFLRDFAAADLQAGTVEVGDGVYFQKIPKLTASTPSITPPSPIQQIEKSPKAP